MFFKLNKTSTLGAALDAIMEKRSIQNDAIGKLAQEITGEQDAKFAIPRGYLSGKILAIQFKNDPGKDWVEMKKHNDFPNRYFYPRSTSKKLWKQFLSANSEDPLKDTAIAELFHFPTNYVDVDEENNHVYTYRSPSIRDIDDVFLIKIPIRWFAKLKQPQPDLIEITESEYIKIEASKKMAV